MGCFEDCISTMHFEEWIFVSRIEVAFEFHFCVTGTELKNANLHTPGVSCSVSSTELQPVYLAASAEQQNCVLSDLGPRVLITDSKLEHAR